MTRLEMVERLAVLVLPPQKSRVLYLGVLVPRSNWRAEVFLESAPPNS